MIRKEKVERILGKKRMLIVEEICQDSEVTEVVLRDGYHVPSYGGETAHVFANDLFRSEGGKATDMDYAEDLLMWFEAVKAKQ